MSTQFYSLVVKDKIQETSDTVSLQFQIPENLKEDFQFLAGQYLTLKFNIDGVEARRAYSMSSSPLEKDITVTIKRVEGGLVSNYIHDKVSIGDTIEVMQPQGKFVPQLKVENRKTYYLFGAGSGITPLISMIKTIVEEEPQSSVFLLYGSRKEDEIIFKNELETLKQKYKGQIHITYTISQPTQVKAAGLIGMIGKKKVLWTGKKGRIDRKMTAIFLEENIPPYPNTEYFICGPGNMLQVIEDVLIARGVNKKQIHFELFNSTLPGDGTKDKSASSDGATAKVKVLLDGKSIELEVTKDTTILDALLELKHEPPYSCTTGSCSTCMAKVSQGKVKMDVCYALDDDEIEDGFVLTCQAKPVSNEVELNYDV